MKWWKSAEKSSPGLGASLGTPEVAVDIRSLWRFFAIEVMARGHEHVVLSFWFR